ncbi:MAG: OmpA family protein [Betaproteobacteria bacterium]|nr:MAG: OmpA family protein [Betaproteobacteria bacterium]TMH31588.1 MAG: OmpA family protein [Betaproteobacteria bacterium]
MARRLLLGTLLLALAGSALAQEVRLYRAGDAVDPSEVAAILAQPSSAAPAMKMRSIRLLDDAPSAQAAPAVAAVAAVQGAAVQQVAAAAVASDTAERPVQRPRVSALSLPVQFAFDSADILPSARHQLDALAEGIRMLPAIQAVVIEGHTDAVGSELYNEQLSQRRAYAVKRYLVASHGIDPARLRAVGMGEYAPLPGRDPYAAENRRVQFRGE